MMIRQDTGNETKARLAANLRRLRIARHLSQSELARITSMSKATLSGIEKARGNPTVDTLASLAGALGASISDLLEEARTGEVRIVRASQSEPPSADAVGYRQLEADAEPHRGIDVYELTLPARYVRNMSPGSAGSRQAMLVLHGKLIAGPVERISELVVGDYISFPADVPHVCEAGRAPARVLVIAYTPA
jgi:transcriptional regulator with XRE-family HTH domain